MFPAQRQHQANGQHGGILNVIGMTTVTLVPEQSKIA
jgi:hypothetical protein